MGTKVQKSRHAARGFMATLFVGVLLTGCGRSERVPASSSPASSSGSLSKIDACKLATPDEAAAALGAPPARTRNAAARSDGAVGCEFDAAVDVDVPYLRIDIEPDGKERFDMNNQDGRPITGLGDEAVAMPSSDRTGGEVMFRKGDLVTSVAVHGLPASTPSDFAAVEARLEKLAALVLTRLPG